MKISYAIISRFSSIPKDIEERRNRFCDGLYDKAFMLTRDENYGRNYLERFVS